MTSEHGTYSRYSRGKCRCFPCRLAYATYDKRRRANAAAGIIERVSVKPAKRHLRAWKTKTGAGLDTFAKLSGVGKRTLFDVQHGRRDLISRHTDSAIRAVPLKAVRVPDRNEVDVTVTRRKAQALAAIGWSLTWQSTELNRIPTNYFRSILSHSVVTRQTADAVDALYRELHLTPGPSNRAKIGARKRGWPPPLAYDDIDDPNETPRTTTSPSSPRRSSSRHEDVDQVVVERLMRGERIFATRAEQEEAVLRVMADPERTLVEFEQQTHLNVRSIAERINTRRRRAA